jgi:DNA-binding XRE family transcriptional regulator
MYKEARKRLGLSQMEVALKIGVCLMTYQLIEKGVTKHPRVETVRKLHELLNIKTLALD